VKRRHALPLLAPLSWLALLAGCGGSAPRISAIEVGSVPAARQVLHRAVDQMPRSLDPTLITDIPAQRLIDDLFEGLTTLGIDGTVKPGVAESWSVSEDGKTWIFHLREAQWSNGEAVTAADFVYAWQREVDPRTAAEYAQTLAPLRNASAISAGKLPPTELGATAIDARTLRVELEAPTAYLLALLTGNFMMPLHRATVERWGESWARPEHLVCNGPFVVSEVVIGNRIVLRRNPRYWDAASVRLEEVVWYPLDRAAQNSRYFAGDLQFTESFSAEQFEWLRLQLGDQVHTAPWLGTFMLAVHMGRPPFANNRALRMALSLAVDRDILTQRVRHGLYQPAYSLVPPLPGYDAVTPPWSRLNAEQRHALARRFYAEAGYDAQHPLRVELVYPTDTDNKQIYDALIAMWKQNLGAEITPYNEEFRVMLQNRRLHSLTLYQAAWFGDFADPYAFLQVFESTSGINNGLYANTEFDRLLHDANSQADDSQRNLMLRQAENMLNADAPYMPLYFYSSRHLIKPYVRGYQINVLDRNPSRYLYLLEHRGS
jgi:oligopeptide transport system substrate-binding protein